MQYCIEMKMKTIHVICFFDWELEYTSYQVPHENINSHHNHHCYQVPHESENENNCLNYRMKTKTKITTIAVSATTAPYENKKKQPLSFGAPIYIE